MSNDLGRFGLLKILDFWREHGDVLDLPDLSNEADFRQWCRELISLGDAMADMTPTDLDDKACKALLKIVENDEAFTAFHAILNALLSDEKEMLVGAEEKAVEAVAEKVGIDSITLLLLIPSIIKFIAWIRERRKNKEG